LKNEFTFTEAGPLQLSATCACPITVVNHGCGIISYVLFTTPGEEFIFTVEAPEEKSCYVQSINSNVFNLEFEEQEEEFTPDGPLTITTVCSCPLLLLPIQTSNYHDSCLSETISLTQPEEVVYSVESYDRPGCYVQSILYT